MAHWNNINQSRLEAARGLLAEAEHMIGEAIHHGPCRLSDQHVSDARALTKGAAVIVGKITTESD